jgi:mRNA-degrading endonuclease RelE of RelBE toxin-antitoxin system
MELTFVYSPRFVREWDRLRLTDEDLRVLEKAIWKAPDAAPVMRGTGGLRKIRFAPPSMHRGKSGATRVGFAYFRTKAAIIVVAIFSKNEASNFTDAERAEIEKWLKLMERDFR